MVKEIAVTAIAVAIGFIVGSIVAPMIMKKFNLSSYDEYDEE
jgi:hypothetical protein